MAASIELLWQCGPATVLLAGARDAPGRQQVLARRLCARQAAATAFHGLKHDGLGRPLAVSADGESLLPGLSFSRHAGWLWAAASRATEVGIDVAGPEDFPDPYPDARVFSPRELHAGALASHSLAEARVLLWSLKEASAKALGTGFHRVEPLELGIHDLRPAGDTFLACRILSPQGGLTGLAGRVHGFRVAVAARMATARSQHG